jgi:hypothetical protein
LSSGVVEVTVAVFRIDPAGATTVVWIVMVAPPPFGIVPSDATTVPFVPAAGPEHVPCVTVHETKVVPGGSGSVTFTPSAAAGPAFATTSV